MRSKSDRVVAWLLIAFVFVVLGVACQAFAAEPGTDGAVAMIDDAQATAVAGEKSILHRTTDPANCPSGNCGRFGYQPPPAAPPQVAQPPQFDFDEPEQRSGVPLGLAIGLPIGCAVLGVGIGVAVQWRKTHTGHTRA